MVFIIIGTRSKKNFGIIVMYVCVREIENEKESSDENHNRTGAANIIRRVFTGRPHGRAPFETRRYELKFPGGWEADVRCALFDSWCVHNVGG